MHILRANFENNVLTMSPDSSVFWRLAMGCTVQGPNPGWGEAKYSAPVLTGAGVDPTSCSMGTESHSW